MKTTKNILFASVIFLTESLISIKNIILFLVVSIGMLSCSKSTDSPSPSPSTTSKNPPEVISVEKFNLTTGSDIQILGKNFSYKSSDNEITINGVKALNVYTTKEFDNTKLFATIPLNATSGSLTLKATGKSFDLGNIEIKQYTQKDNWQLASYFPDDSNYKLFFTNQNKAYFIGNSIFNEKNIEFSDKNIYSIYEFSNNTWVAKKDIPFTPTAEDIIFSVNGKGYIMVIRTNVAGVFSRVVWEYDPVTDNWSQLSNFPGTPRTGASIFVINNKAYYGLGTSESLNYLGDIWEFDGITKKWSQKRNFPYFSNFFGNSILWKAYKNNIGYFLLSGVPNAFNATYDPQSDTWSKIDINSNGSGNLRDLISANNKIYGISYGFGIFRNEDVKLFELDTNLNKFNFIKNFAGPSQNSNQNFILNNTLFVGIAPLYRAMWSTNL
jgi:N-acetylneuraminic acid mutarotase